MSGMRESVVEIIAFVVERVRLIELNRDPIEGPYCVFYTFDNIVGETTVAQQF
jgi:hypothetical protein